MLAITIHGQTDTLIYANDINGRDKPGHATVYEKGLTSGTDTSETATGTIMVSAPHGLLNVTVDGTVVTLAQLNALGTTPVSIDTGEGI